jgi:hypothetical protein
MYTGFGKTELKAQYAAEGEAFTTKISSAFLHGIFGSKISLNMENTVKDWRISQRWL